MRRPEHSGRDTVWMGAKVPRPGVQDDNAANHGTRLITRVMTTCWDNIFLGRLASHPWGAMRFVAAFIGGGILDRYPSLRFGTLECGFGWLLFWGKRIRRAARREIPRGDVGFVRSNGPLPSTEVGPALPIRYPPL